VPSDPLCRNQLEDHAASARRAAPRCNYLLATICSRRSESALRTRATV
jgi:hypothetical protein